ncbi:MAG: tRNA 2-thiouridine(34) synthase MnmA [Patescibacteria group bacterium]
MTKKKAKVFVAMSGGVDSSVAAALLKKGGFDMVGIYMKCWNADDPLYRGCTSVDDERSARLAAAHLGIPFYTWNFIKEYRERVVEYLLEGYQKGITPNPDVACNKEIKFGLFFEKAMILGADFVATGHYARVEHTDGRMSILAGKDKNKDQSYFLSFVKPEVLSRVLFPVGDHTKEEVRTMARKFGLPNAERKSSQGICFVGKVDFRKFLMRYIPSQTGDIVDISGNTLGKHEGVFYYTIGQRKGIRLSGGPYYVIGKDMEQNLLVVSKDEKDLYKKEVKVRDINWFVSPSERSFGNVAARIRYRQPFARSTLHIDSGDKVCIIFEAPQRAITPGQIAVIYRGDQLLGAGVIE